MSEYLVTLQLKDSDHEIDKEFDSLEKAQAYLKGIGEEMIQYVDMAVFRDFDSCDFVDGYAEIMEYGR